MSGNYSGGASCTFSTLTGSARISRSPTPHALYYSSVYSSRVPRSPTPHALYYSSVYSSRVPRSPTPRALYYSSTCYACYLPFPSRELLAPLAFPNTARPVLLKRLPRKLRRVPVILFPSSSEFFLTCRRPRAL